MRNPRHGALAAACLGLLAAASRGAQLPIVCVAGSCGPNAPSAFVSSGQATATSVGNTLTVNQTSEQAVLNWASFNIGVDGKVVFKQPDGSAIALNQIFQASPSQIFGMLQANGQIYLINQNGFIFGATAKVNASGLVASSLPLTNSLSSGLLSAVQSSLPALASDGRTSVLDASGNPVLGTDGKSLMVQLIVQPGAQIAAADGGRVLLAAQSVTNGGTVSAPDGQVVLAAGQSVFIQASTDPALRGLIVEVDGGGLVTNQGQGSISVAEGNATLVGLAVNQQGRISATTSVSENGSIQLLARDTVGVQSVAGRPTLEPSHGGTLALGTGSQTSVLPDASSTATAVDAQAQPQSTITLAGKTVELMDGSNIKAPGGLVSITASSTPSFANDSLTPDPAAHLRIDSGAVIDVSGSVASVPVASNLVSVQLRGSQLADSPLQRNGALRGDTVIVDARVGTPLADVSADIALIPRNVLQRTSTGGSIVLDSGGDVVVAPGATLNVSGGQVDYTPGYIQTSLLLKPDGSTVDIGAASPDQIYTSVINPTVQTISDTFGVIQFIPTPGIAHLDPGYIQGSSAGSIQVLGSSLVLGGTFLGQAVNGIYQRNGSGVASGGTFTIGTTFPGSNSAGADYRAPAVELVNQAPTVVVGPNASLPSDLPVQVAAGELIGGGFTHLAISSNDSITIPSGVVLDLGPGGSISLLAPKINLAASVDIPAGSISLISSPTFSSPQGTAGAGIFVGSGVILDVSGMWTNDGLLASSATPTGLALSNAGSIELEQEIPSGLLSIGSGVQFLANGGAQLQRGNVLTGGTGGSIAWIGSPGGTVEVGAGDVIQGFGVQGAAGGAFSLEVPRLAIGSGDTTWLRSQTATSDPTSSSVFAIDAALFSNFGFSKFNLTADGPAIAAGTSADILSVAPGTVIDLLASTLLLNSGAPQEPSGTSLSGFSTPTLLQQYQRLPSVLSLAATPGNILQTQIGNLTVGHNASITADPGSSITLSAVGNLTFDGLINAPSGSVAFNIVAPGEAFDPGYLPGLQIELGKNAAINVAGTTIYQPSATGLLTGQVLAGGSVALTAARGSVVTDAGSVINFSGTEAPVDILVATGSTATQRETVASAAGSLAVTAPEAISLLGTYIGAAGVGTTGIADGGTLSLTLSRLNTPSSGFPDAPAVITVQTTPLTTVLAPDSGSAILSTTQLATSGVDALNLTADNAVQFTNGAQLSLARSLILTAPAVQVASQGVINVTAPYIALGTGSSLEAAAHALPGAGSIVFNASELDLIGALAFQGVSTAKLVSSGEILLRGELNDVANLGSLSVAGTLTLSSARVVPTTLVDYTITASGGSNNTVQFVQNGSLSGVPLSVGGALTVNADTIIQGGTVFAPFGQLSFSANDNLTFASGSLTSVSGNGSILPYGEVQNGTSWVYQVSPTQLAPAPVTALPTRQVTVSGAKVTLASGAAIDVSGGGEVSAYEWTPGTGGTTDVLANTVTPGLYAVIPSLLGQTAPYDPMAWAGSNITPNESVYLSAGSGIAAGVYPLLPARYALLPGAFLVSVASGNFQDQPAGVVAQAGNGFPIVSGYFTNGSTGIGATRTTGFLVEPGSYAGKLATYSNVAASEFFAATAATAAVPSSALPADGGILVVSVQSAFTALGKVNGAPATGGEGATVEISAPQIEVVAAGSAPTVAAGLVQLSSDVIDGWNAGRLWLGLNETNGSVQVGSSSVELAAGSKLTADEIVLAALGSVQVDAGAVMMSTSALTGSPTAAAATALQTSLPLTGASSSAAVLIASDLTYWLPQRSGMVTATSGTVDIAAGAMVSSRGALTIDAPGGGTLGDGALVGSGAQWALGATSVNFAPQDPASAGFNVDSSLLAALQHAGGIRFASVDAINLAQAVTLGTGGAASINEIDFVAPGFSAAANAGSSVFSAGVVSLSGGTSAGTVPHSGAATLSLLGHEIDIDAGSFGLSGFASVTLDASNVLRGQGAGSLTTAGNLTVLTPVLTASSDAQTALTAGGTVVLAASPEAPSGSTSLLQSGGALSISGNSLTDSTLISMPSGEVYLNTSQQLSLGTGAGIQVAGVQPANAAHGSDGGLINLNAGGNLSVSSGTTLSVDAGPGANAGAISIVAGGIADLEGQLSGLGAASMRSGSFTLQAASLPNFAVLNNSLEQSGFHNTRAIEVGSGDLDLGPGSSITAQTVILTADAGAINIGGVINASGTAGGGSITLSAHDDLSAASTAILAANGLGASAGGQIELASLAGLIQLDAAAQVSAGGAANSGTLLVRAPALVGDVGVASLPASLTHIGTVILEPIIAATLGAAPSNADFAAIESTLAQFMSAAAPTLLNRLGLGATSNVIVRPYADLTATSDLTLGSEDFSTWRFGGQPADISIRTPGAISVTGTLSDGFNNSSGWLDVGSTASARITLVAGANLSSASSTAVLAGSASDLTLAADSIIRSGTGALSLVAARDILFGDGASVYTGGVQGAPTVSSTDTGIPLSFATGGGNITVSAGRDIVGAPVNEAVDDWNPRFLDPRSSQPNPAAIWGIDFQAFQWNIGALAGGNVVVNAGRNAVDVSAAVADSRTFAADDMTSIALGGGNLSVTAGADIDSGLFFVGNGLGKIAAGGALSSSLTSAGKPFGTLLLAGDASFYVSAQRDLLLQGMVSETALQPDFNSDFVYFFRYGPSSILSLQSRGGSVTYDSNPLADSIVLGVTGATQSDPGVFNAAPPNIDIAAFGADVVVNARTEALPSSTGQLTVYAARDITGPTGSLAMSDEPLTLPASADAPSEFPSISITSSTSYTFASLHQNDPTPIVIAAGRDIDDFSLALPKLADISAGRDIASLTFAGQNLNPNEVTVLRAGRNISYGTDDETRSIALSGPGQLELIAGGNVDLGFTAGITTYGNIINPNLTSAVGASISVLAGLGAPLGVGGAPSTSDFVATVIAPSMSSQTTLVNYVEQQTGQTALSFANAAAAFRNFAMAQQLPLIDELFFSALVLSGQQANAVPSLGFGLGYGAIDSLFPGSRSTSSPDSGSVTLGYSRIYTLDGGSISILAPGGGVNVGLANPPANFSLIGLARQPSDLGIVAVGSGAVNIYSLSNVLVNQSRVFTLGGGAISIWSTLGNIDAGNGAKTSISAPPPAIQVDANGNVTLDFGAAIAGSGIRTIQSEPGVSAGDVSLIAPVGFVDAGDAGIGASGNINIAAQHVIGATNINFGGTATGVPPETSGLGASLAAAATAANGTTTSATNSVDNTNASTAAAAPLAAAALGWLDVLVEGFGEEVCKANDLDCLKRNHK